MKNLHFPATLQRASVIALNAAWIAAIAAAPALAVTVPGSVDPSKLEQRFDQSPESAPSSNLETPVAGKKRPISDKLQQQLAKQKFVLKKVVIEGSTVFTPDELKFSYEDMIGKQISLVDAQRIVERITNDYHSHDYILSQAVAPAQNIKDGVLKIKVIEGYISNVVLQGDVKKNAYRNIAASYGEELKKARPVKNSDLERYLLLMNDLPGATAKGVVRPGATPGSSELVVNFTHKTFEASYTIDNRGTKTVGPWESTATATANSIFGMYDRTLVRIISASPYKELSFFDLQHEEQIDDEGTRLDLDASHSRSLPGDFLKPLDIDSESDSFEAKVLHPFIRSRQENLTGRVAFDFRNTDTDALDANLTEDRTRVLRLGGSYDTTDSWLGANLIDTQISQGLDIFNSSRRIDEESNTNASGVFTKVNLDISRTQALPYNFSILTSASGQYAFEPLLSAEQFSLGGVGYGQAYDPAQLTGDDGLAGKVELRYGQAVNYRYFNAYQLYSYYDIGRVWIRDGGLGADDKKSLASLGVGVRANFTSNLSSNLELGKPLTLPVGEDDKSNAFRIFVSTTARF